MKRPRARWLTLGEIVAVAGVVVAGLGVWNGVADRRVAEADKVAGRQAASVARGRLALRGIVGKDHDLVTLSGAGGREIIDVRIAFPAALGVDAHDAPDDRLLRDWFAKPLLATTEGKQAGLLPVLVTYGWSDDDGTTHHAGGVYDVVWRTEGRAIGFLRGRALEVTGFRLRASGGDQAKLDAAWARERPAGS